MVTAGEIMTRKVITVTEGTNLEDLCGLLYEARITGVPVVDDEGRLVGIVSKDDVVGAFFAGREDAGKGTAAEPADLRVGDIMTEEVVTATEDTPVAEICHLMVTKGIHRVPIMKESRVVGIVSALNVLDAFLQGRLKL